MKDLFIKIKEYLKRVMLFTTSYSINAFLSPLSSKEEEYYLNEHLNGNKEPQPHTKVNLK